MNNYADTIYLIKNNYVMMEILKDSFGGVLYNLANKNKYDTVELLQLWDSLNESEKESAGGIIKGAMQFIKE